MLPMTSAIAANSPSWRAGVGNAPVLRDEGSACGFTFSSGRTGLGGSAHHCPSPVCPEGSRSRRLRDRLEGPEPSDCRSLEIEPDLEPNDPRLDHEVVKHAA